jgi:hypothetical protein
MVPQAEAPHIAGLVPMEDVTLSFLDRPATPLIDAAPSFVDPSLATLASIGTTADHSTTSLIGGAPLSALSLVDPSAIPSSITDVTMAIDHSTTPPINVVHINGDLNTQPMSTAAAISTAMSTMGSNELNNPVASTTQILVDISAAPSNVPTNFAVIAEKGPTGMTKKAGIMRPNSHSKTAR